MALIQCPECGKRVSSFAKSCPECGYPIAKQENEEVDIQPEHNAEVAPNGIAENKDDYQPDNEQVFFEPDIEKEKATPSNDKGKRKQTKKRKLWIIPVLLVCLVLAGIITYSAMLKDAEQKKAEARRLYSQEEYMKLAVLVYKIPKFLIDEEWENYEYAGQIGSGLSLYNDNDASERALRSLITNVWFASSYKAESLSNEQLSIKGVITQEYYTQLEDRFGLSKQQIDEAVSIGNNATNETRGVALDEYVSALFRENQDKSSQEPTQDLFAQYISENNVTLDNYDVQYNMSNNLDKEFSLVGYAELDDYYNYGFDDELESTYFCLQVTPEDGKYSNAWYIYCHRSSCQTLLDKTQAAGKKYVKMICYIPKGRFEKGQNNMAMLRYVVY